VARVGFVSEESAATQLSGGGCPSLLTVFDQATPRSLAAHLTEHRVSAVNATAGIGLCVACALSPRHPTSIASEAVRVCVCVWSEVFKDVAGQTLAPYAGPIRHTERKALGSATSLCSAFSAFL
jgi:hypothetical protein